MYMYDIILQQMKILIPATNVERLLVDFEMAATCTCVSAFQGAYPLAASSSLCQNVLTNLDESRTKQEYRTDNVVSGAVRCLAA